MYGNVHVLYVRQWKVQCSECYVCVLTGAQYKCNVYFFLSMYRLLLISYFVPTCKRASEEEGMHRNYIYILWLMSWLDMVCVCACACVVAWTQTPISLMNVVVGAVVK